MPVDDGEPAGAGGARATLTPDCALAAPVSCTDGVFWFYTVTGPIPPPAAATPTCVLALLVWASPARAVALPLLALVPVVAGGDAGAAFVSAAGWASGCVDAR